MEKSYYKIIWHNIEDATDTPLDADNLNAISQGLDTVDDRVIELDRTRLPAVVNNPRAGEVIKYDGEKWVNGVGGGGGTGGTSDYIDLDNKPKINGVTLLGDRPLSAFGIYDPIKLTKTVPVGATTFRFYNVNIKPDVLIDVYTSVYGISPKS